MNLFNYDEALETARRYQWFTPEWAALELYQRHFDGLGSGDVVLEPSCGHGAFLKAVPAHIEAIGVEIDPLCAEVARTNTGREIIVADFTTMQIPETVSTIIGNPPYVVPLIDAFIRKAASHLTWDNRMGLLLPAYALQTHTNVNRWLDKFSIECELIPRRLFPRLRLPLVFVVFTRNHERQMWGMALYKAAVDVDAMSPNMREIATNGRPSKSVWRAVVDEALHQLGGEGKLQDIYRVIEPKRPTPNAFWKEKVRQILQIHFTPSAHGVWRNEAA